MRKELGWIVEEKEREKKRDNNVIARLKGIEKATTEITEKWLDQKLKPDVEVKVRSAWITRGGRPTYESS